MVTSIVSSLTNIPVKEYCNDRRSYNYRTSSSNRRIERKIVDAHRAGVKSGIPKENERFIDMPKKIVDEIKITPVEFADQVLK